MLILLHRFALRLIRLRLTWALAALLIVGFALVAHGCHGPDEDHELFARRHGPADARRADSTSPPVFNRMNTAR